MRITTLVPALAAVAALPMSASAFEIAGDGWTFAIEPRIQTRAEFASASAANGDDDLDIWASDSDALVTGDDIQAYNFYVRRARLYMKGASDDGWFFEFTLRADKIGLESPQSNVSDSIDVHDLYAGKRWTQGEVDHLIAFGLDDWGHIAAKDSSAKYLLPNTRLTTAVGGINISSVGLDYRFKTDMLNGGLTIAEAPSKESAPDDNADVFISARLATSLKPEWAIKRSGSYLGAEGFGHEAGLEVVMHSLDGDDSLTAFGVDYLVHYNQLSGLFEAVFTSTDDVDGMVALAQAGWAVPLASGRIVEPAARLTLLDGDTDDDSPGVLLQEGSADGLYVDLGVNYYINGHANKLQAGLQLYTPEEGDGDAVAFRLGHNLEF
ncbi:MAG: hypothetical protein ACOCXA_01535 [Planctomycetota bacterium]